jgi:cephalosporin-C deacetylase
MRLFLCITLLAVSLAAFTAVKIEQVGDAFTVTGDIYTAKVTKDGALSSLMIGEVEFMAPPTVIGWNGKPTILPGVFAAPMNQWYKPYLLPGGAVMRENTIRAEGNGWWIEYAFGADFVDFTYNGAPEGGRGFRAGYPPAELYLSLSHDLGRASDPENQGELGWPVNRPHEPGNYTILAKNGAGFHATDVTRMQAINHGWVTAEPHRLDLLIYNTYDPAQKPITHRWQLFTKADLAHSVTMEIMSPNPDHIFPENKPIVFPVKVTALYGHTLAGTLAFKGSPYVWKTPEVTGSVPLTLTAAQPTVTVQLPIHPPKPAHITGLISVTDGKAALYNQRIGFLYRPAEIPRAEPPADFDAFWEKTLAELEKIPLDLTMEPQPKLETAQGVVYKIKYRSWGGRWAWAWLTVPKKEDKVPGTLICPAVSVWQPPPAGPANGTLFLQMAIHGGDVGDYPAKSDFDYMNTNIIDRETYMLRYSYCCLARSYDILKSLPQCNGVINVQGGSQGAGLSLVMAGLRPVNSVRGVAIALCRIDWTILGYTQWGPSCPKDADPKKVAEVVRYYDPANFAHRINAPLRLCIGLFDFCAPAEGIFTAINALPKETKCAVFVDPYAGHFTINSARFNSNDPGIEIPRWHGTAEDNKVAKPEK